MTLHPPLIALVGRPNVGKSTLFNRLVGRRAALVLDLPGVTRDRLFGDSILDDRMYRVVDTGGLDLGSNDVFLGAMEQQTQLAIEEADFIVFVLDGQDGVRPDDVEIARKLRRSGKPMVGVVNKLDVPKHRDNIAEFYELGLESLLPLSAEHGEGFGDLVDTFHDRLDAPDAALVEAARGAIPVSEDEPEEGVTSRVEWEGGPIRVAVVGRPNVGKSSLINQLLGEERLLATNVAGTTRDSVDTELVVDDQRYVLVDTAGMRRKRSISDTLERFSVFGSVRSIDSADIVVVVLDATQVPAEQDIRIAALAHERGKGIILVVNKWDLLKDPDWRDRYVDDLRYRVAFLDYAPVIRVSAKTGRSVGRILSMVLAAQCERHRRVSTSELNRFSSAVVASHPPAVRRGRRPKLYFGTQPMVRPPTFIFMTNHSKYIQNSYKRYLENALRERYGFHATPIWVKFRERERS